MKKIALLLVLVFTISACSVSDDGPQYTLEVLPVESYTLPQTFGYGETYTITLRYKKPTNCYAFKGFYYEKNATDRYVGVVASKPDTEGCDTDDTIYEATFQFECTEHFYTFHFYKGDNADGSPIFEDVPVEVTY